jgi:hypothetical protein
MEVHDICTPVIVRSPTIDSIDTKPTIAGAYSEFDWVLEAHSKPIGPMLCRRPRDDQREERGEEGKERENQLVTACI